MSEFDDVGSAKTLGSHPAQLSHVVVLHCVSLDDRWPLVFFHRLLGQLDAVVYDEQGVVVA